MSADTKYELLALAAIAAWIGVPIGIYKLSGRIAAKMSKKRAPWMRAGGVIATILSFITLMPIAFVIAVCWGPPSGESTVALAAKQRATKVIDALAQYRSTRGHYPDALDSLGSQVMAVIAADSTSRGSGYYAIHYARDSTGYSLTFRYGGPGMNVCEYHSDRAAWRCYGYF